MRSAWAPRAWAALRLLVVAGLLTLLWEVWFRSQLARAAEEAAPLVLLAAWVT